MSRTSFTRYAVTIPDIVTAIGKLRWKRLPSFSDRRKAVFAPINIVGRRDTINEMINMNTHDYNARGYAARYRDESAMVKVRRMNVHLKGQGKMQVSNGGVDKKNLYKRNGQSCQLQSSRFKNTENDELVSNYTAKSAWDDVRDEKFWRTLFRFPSCHPQVIPFVANIWCRFIIDRAHRTNKIKLIYAK